MTLCGIVGMGNKEGESGQLPPDVSSVLRVVSPSVTLHTRLNRLDRSSPPKSRLEASADVWAIRRGRGTEYLTQQR